jgi:SAM-dependent methyltransferase
MPVLAKTHRAHRPAVLFTYNPKVRWLARRVLPLLTIGHDVECPCCDRQFSRFISRHGVDSLCPGCLALQRHRLLVLYLLRETAVATGALAVLHIAPEEGVQAKLVQFAGADYVTLDASPSPIVSVVGDVTALPFSPDSFDLVVCSHVLEHVVDDATALREFFRVLRPGGSAVLPHPVHDDRATTFEDSTITSPRERLLAFGATDHVRVYGRDFADRVHGAGFDVARVDYLATLDRDMVRKNGLGAEGKVLYIGTKPLAGSSATPTESRASA